MTGLQVTLGYLVTFWFLHSRREENFQKNSGTIFCAKCLENWRDHKHWLQSWLGLASSSPFLKTTTGLLERYTVLLALVDNVIILALLVAMAAALRRVATASIVVVVVIVIKNYELFKWHATHSLKSDWQKLLTLSWDSITPFGFPVVPDCSQKKHNPHSRSVRYASYSVRI